jgi:hypothetical protein
LGLNLSLAGRTERLLNPLCEKSEIIIGDWSVLAGLADAIDDLLAAKGFSRATSLDD